VGIVVVVVSLIVFFAGCSNFQVVQEEYGENGELIGKVMVRESYVIYGKGETGATALVDVRSATSWKVEVGADRKIDQSSGMEGFWGPFWKYIGGLKQGATP